MNNSEVPQNLPPLMLETLSQIPSDVPAALVTRHSIREQGGNLIASYEVPLTPEGKQLAEWLGAKLPTPVANVHSSPVGRCLETGERLLKGANEAHLIQTNALLVEPGSFVQDIQKVGGFFLKKGPIEFVNRHIAGDVRGMKPLEQGALDILYHVRQHLDKPGTLSIHVTHDTILAPLVAYLQKSPAITQADWPQMMEGIVLWFDADKVHWVWRGEKGDTVLP
ncbi:MAG TPA: histidine phosphatase family protein, partial [Pseudomonadales bacterium]|nr:histidine phosphatase family protein [Pseudomonadales bacterium]